MLKKFYLLLFVTAFCICLSAAMASADVIYSDLGSPAVYNNTSNPYGAYGSAYILGPTSTAAQFVAGGTGTTVDVAQIDVAVERRFSTTTSIPGNFQVSIWESTNSNLPGLTSVYTSPELTATGVWQESTGSLVTIGNISGVTLDVGKAYFLSVNAFGPTDDVVWDPSSQQSTGQAIVISSSGGGWQLYSNGGALLPAFDILGEAPVTGVPEPCTMLLLGLGLMGVAGIRKKIGK